ncbi:RICIN domain-containing protein [Paenibacillus aestuarii]|uniref:galactosylceramidase n=1 Tax=Paenibacillus aestuarii TaxID=516965 RepID=A0ABW0KAT2_9BACL|nr:RICIN domain-containing protein [Paenibacillus aestuarii]
MLKRLRKNVCKIIPIAMIASIVCVPAPAAFADNSTIVDPSVQFQTVEGWGTSLAWWGYVVGGYANKTDYADKIFGSSGLNLNIARYNIGGGENPNYLPPNQTYLMYRARIPGFLSSNGTYDWTADANQRWMLQAAKARGADQFEAFSNSPPYWMTNSGSVSGAADGSDNLNSNYYDAFADYLTTVVKQFKDTEGITFRTLNPLNEPIAGWWKLGNRQEGAHFDRSSQNTILSKVAASLSSKGLGTKLSGSDENTIDDALTSFNSLSSATKNSVYQINTHSYGGSQRVQLANAAQSNSKKLWMSEYGDGDATGLTMSSTILKDMKQMHASGWVYWQAVDDADGWGFLKNSLNSSGDTSYTINQKYYIMGNYSKFIRPGYKIIAINDDNSLVAYDPASSNVVIVTTNSSASDKTVSYDLSKFSAITGNATPYRTSSTEQLAQLPSISLNNKTFSATAKAGSVTTYVIDGASYSGGLDYNPSTYYTIKSQNSGMLADVKGESLNPGTAIDQWSATSGNNQQWSIQGYGDGTYYLVNRNSGMVMEVTGSSTTAGASVIQYPYGGSNNQKWRITSVGNGFYKLVNVNSGMALDVIGASRTAGTALDQWTDNGGTNQHWSFGSSTVNIDGTGSGRVFDGEGVLSGGGGNTKLLIDYPEPYRSDILDYLFKPNFGASYQELKFEIGGDINSTSGTEPSHARTRDENANPVMTRGYETWLINEAKKRNPNIKLSALQWGAPAWVGNMWSQDNADYLVSYIKGLKSVWGYDLDYIGGSQNESYNGTSQQARDYIVNILRPTLDRNGLSNVKIVAPDIYGNDWGFADKIVNDPALKNAVAAIGYHYVNSTSTSNAQNSGLPIWESEGWTGIGDWNGAFNLAKEMNLNYINAKLTKTDVWHLIGAQYNNTAWAHSGIMQANSPWSGNYVVQPAVWAAAHTTQFAAPGWQYLDSGSGIAPGGSSYVTFKNPNSGDYSIVIVSGGSPESMTFNLTGGLSNGAVHVWKSNSSAQFIQQSDIQPNAGSYSINLEANSIYTLTTTTGQQKGAAANAIPADQSFPKNYSENFESYTVGKTPKYTYDIEGAFEVSNSFGGGVGKTLRQVILKPLIPWNVWGEKPDSQNPSTFTEFGDLKWQNYDYSVDTLIENAGAVNIYGRVGSELPGGHPEDYKGYRLSIYDNGQWYLCYGDPSTYGTSNDVVLASGTVTGFSANTWHNLKLSFVGTTIKAFVDNNQIASVTDSRRGSGMVGLGSGWNNAQYDNVNVSQYSPVTSVQVDKPQISLNEGQTTELVAAVLPENATNKNVTWSSSDETVAKVEVKDGKTVVTALKAGAADITVTTAEGNFTAVSKVTVTPSIPLTTVTSVQVDKPQISLNEGQTTELVAAVLPENATNKNVAWSSSDETVAKVEVKDGKTVVTALKAGAADITVTTADGNFTAVSKVTVVKGVVTPSIPLTTLSAAGTVQTGDEFTVQLGLGSVTQNVYAQDFKMDYDSNVFEFVSARAVNDGLQLVKTKTDTLGKLRFILASVGKPMTGDAGILELKFRARAVAQPATGTIAVTNAMLADGQGVETTVQASTVNVSIATAPPVISGDVNHDNKVSIGDLGFVAANYGKTSSSPDWEQIKQADVTGDGKIDIADLVFVAIKIFE